MTFYIGAKPWARLPEVGALVVMRHEVFRVTEINPIPETDWTDDERSFIVRRTRDMRDKFIPAYIVVRPIHITGDDSALRRHDRHFRFQATRATLYVYPDEHYPVCATCGEPMPCRDQLQAREAKAAVDRMSRYENPDRCPHCLEGFGPRQKTRTFHHNVEIPAGPPVRFHMRRGCRFAANKYADRCGEQDNQQAMPFREGDTDE